MKAAALSSFGGPEVLTFMDLPVPQASPGQVRIRVRSAGVNHFDTAIRQGWAPPSVDNSFPVIPGNEFAGVVDQVGEGVTGNVMGDEVLGFCTLGGYAEFVLASPEQLVRKPENLPLGHRRRIRRQRHRRTPVSERGRSGPRGHCADPCGRRSPGYLRGSTGPGVGSRHCHRHSQ
ncbi:zinc-binding alcohol dehydrogenase family protein [Streptomyces sp. NPDC001922]|uniref:quinone oxidoreductase family protein n=1 Tax=Streptomyces sp. NPDC001922 TaxID=3364624 RepID=UPI0036A503AE